MTINKAYVLAGVTIACAVLGTLAVLSRCYVRFRMVKAFGWDDLMAVVALVAYILYTITISIGIWTGDGKHTRDMTPGQASIALKCWYFGYIAYCAGVTMMKVSIGFFLLRITVDRVQRIIVHLAILFSICVGLCFWGVVTFQCTPNSYYWRKYHPGATGRCIPDVAFVSLGYVYSAVSAATDLTFGLLPMVLVYHLDVERRTKVVLVPILGMGAIASCAALIRMAYIRNLASDDFLFDTLDIALWSSIEVGLALIASSLTTLRPLFRRTLRVLGACRVQSLIFSGRADLNARHSSLNTSSGSNVLSKPYKSILSAFEKRDFDVWREPKRQVIGSLESLPISTVDEDLEKGVGTQRSATDGDPTTSFGVEKMQNAALPTKRCVSFQGSPNEIHIQTDIEIESSRRSQSGVPDAWSASTLVPPDNPYYAVQPWRRSSS